MNGIAAYGRNRVESAPSDQLLLMLLEKVIEKLAVANEAVMSGDRPRLVTALNHCRAIFFELLRSLDVAAAPDVAEPLVNTYRWCINQLIEVGRLPDPTAPPSAGGPQRRESDLAALTRLDDVTRSLHATWTQALAIRDGQAEAR